MSSTAPHLSHSSIQLVYAKQKNCATTTEDYNDGRNSPQHYPSTRTHTQRTYRNARFCLSVRSMNLQTKKIKGQWSVGSRNEGGVEEESASL